MRTLLIYTGLTLVLDAVADRASRALLDVDASKTLWGTLATRLVAWYLAWHLTQPAGVASTTSRR